MLNLVLVHLETVLVSAHDRCTVSAKRTIGLEIILDTHTMVLLGDEAKVKLVSVHLEIVLTLTRDRCTVCAEHTIDLEIVFDAPDGTPM
jgi:hypothetical protein